MHRIDGPGATPGNQFTEGSPGAGIEATTVTDDFLNAVQEEIANTVEGAGITLNKADNTQLSQAIGSLSGSRAGSRNLLINGAFDIWQRDTVASSGVSVGLNSAAGEKYTADRWHAAADGSTGGAGQLVVSQQSHAVGQTDVPGEPQYYCRIFESIASTIGRPTFGQKIEDVRRTAGRLLTVSFYAKASVALSINLVLTQVFGAGGSANVQVSLTAVAIDTGWARHAYTITVPSIAGKTIGTSHYLDVAFQLVQGSTPTIEFSNVQVELGNQVSAYDRRTVDLELQLCQRYYEKSWPHDVPTGTSSDNSYLVGPINDLDASTATAGRGMAGRFRVVKRATPSVVWYGTTGTINVWTYLGTGGTTPVTSSQGMSVQSTGWPAPVGGSPGSADMLGAHFAADAEL